MKFKDFMEKTKLAEYDFQVGYLITINGIINLCSILKTKFYPPYLKCSHLHQDYVELVFGILIKDSRGGIVKPSALGLGFCLARFIIDRIKEDKSKISILEFKEALKIYTINYSNFHSSS